MRKKAEKVSNGLVNVPNIDIEYRGFHIVPKRDFGNYPHHNVNTYKKGYVVTQDGMNVMAGATWASSVIEAKVMIDSHIEADGDGDLFWKIMRKKQGLDEYEEV
jgi:hypothetical protein